MTIRIAGIVSLLLVLGCATTALQDDSRPDARDAVSIATDATFRPFHYVDDAGDVTGFDIELSRELARRSGYATTTVVVPYDRLFDDLLAGRHHVVAATTGITPQREEKYLFSEAYFSTCQAALVRDGEGEPGSISELAGRRVGAAGAGTSVAALSQLPDSIPVILSEDEADKAEAQKGDGVSTLERGEIDAVIVDELAAIRVARASGGRLRVLQEPVALEQYGFVFAPGSDALKRAFDDALEGMRQDGSLEAMQRRFGLDRGDDWPVCRADGH